MQPLLLLLATLSVTASQIVPDEDPLVMAQASNRFAFDVYGQLSGTDGNLCISPTSLYAALFMTAVGADGETAAEMERTLRLRLSEGRDPWTVERARRAYATLLRETNLTHDEAVLRVVNTLWGDESFPFREQTLQELEQQFDAGLRRVDYVHAPEKARKTINHWVQEATNGRIRDLITEGLLDSSTRLVLTNAVYFKNTWQEPFSERATIDAPFHLASGKSPDVPTMRKTHWWRYAEDADAQVLELDYRHGSWALTLILPKDANGLAALEAKLDSQRLDGWVKAFESKRVALELPKFEFEDEHSLNRALARLGMPTAFTTDADFSRFAGDGGSALMIDQVLQKTFITVDEKGTEAAAATAVLSLVGSAIPDGDPIAFQANHPFLFLIRDHETGQVLFMGRVADPRS